MASEHSLHPRRFCDLHIGGLLLLRFLPHGGTCSPQWEHGLKPSVFRWRKVPNQQPSDPFDPWSLQIQSPKQFLTIKSWIDDHTIENNQSIHQSFNPSINHSINHSIPSCLICSSCLCNIVLKRCIVCSKVDAAAPTGGHWAEMYRYVCSLANRLSRENPLNPSQGHLFQHIYLLFQANTFESMIFFLFSP